MPPNLGIVPAARRRRDVLEDLTRDPGDDSERPVEPDLLAPAEPENLRGAEPLEFPRPQGQLFDRYVLDPGDEGLPVVLYSAAWTVGGAAGAFPGSSSSSGSSFIPGNSPEARNALRTAR